METSYPELKANFPFSTVTGCDLSSIKSLLCGSSKNLLLENVHFEAEQDQSTWIFICREISNGNSFQASLYSKCQAAQGIRVAFQVLEIESYLMGSDS